MKGDQDPAVQQDNGEQDQKCQEDAAGETKVGVRKDCLVDKRQFNSVNKYCTSNSSASGTVRGAGAKAM